MWTDAEVEKFAKEFVMWYIDGVDELDVEDWWSENHVGEYFKEANFHELVKLLRESKIIIKHGR